MRIGVIGLGVMGMAMADRLIAAGHEVRGFDIDPSRSGRLIAMGGRTVEHLEEAVTDADLVVLSLPDEAALRSVASQIAALGDPGVLCVDTGTFSLKAKWVAHRILAGAGIEMIDAPVSGTGLQAADGTLVVMASGSADGFHTARPLFEAIGRATYFLGEFGNGTKMKFIANLLVAIHNLATAEAHALAVAAGLDPATVQEVISVGVGSSRIFEIRGPKMLDGDYEPTVRLDLILKDSLIIREFAADLGSPTPLLDAAVHWYNRASQAGLGDHDPAILFTLLQESGREQGQ